MQFHRDWRILIESCLSTHYCTKYYIMTEKRYHIIINKRRWREQKLVGFVMSKNPKTSDPYIPPTSGVAWTLQAGSRWGCSPDTAPSGTPGPRRRHSTAAAYKILGTEPVGCRGKPATIQDIHFAGYHIRVQYSRRADLGVVIMLIAGANRTRTTWVVQGI